MTTERPVALVTGASSGIGKETALALVAAGFHVAGTGRDTSHVTPLDGVTLLDLDVVSDASVAAAVQETSERIGRIGRIGASSTSRPCSGSRPSPTWPPTPPPSTRSRGCTESLDHEVRDHGVRALIVEPAYTRTGFEANSAKPDGPLHAYAKQPQTVNRVMVEAVRGGDAPAIVAKAIVAAATAPKPKPRCTAGPLAGRARVLRRLAPTAVIDKQVRKMNQLAG